MVTDLFESNTGGAEFGALLYRKSGKYPYVSEYDQSCDILYELCGIKVSAGSTVLLPQYSSARSAVFVDGRYKLAAKIALDPSRFEILDNDLPSIVRWIKGKLPLGSRLAYDPRFFSIRSLGEIRDCLTDYVLVPVDLEKITGLHLQKRSLKVRRLHYNHPSSGSGTATVKSKFAPIHTVMEQNHLDAYLVCDPCSMSWILDIRDLNTPFSPVIFGYFLIKRDGETVLYLDGVYEEETVNLSELSDVVGIVKFERDLVDDLKVLVGKNGVGGSVGLDIYETPSHILSLLPTLTKYFRHVNNPCIAAKAIKNDAEVDGMKRAASVDSSAIKKVLDWVKAEICEKSERNITELDVFAKLIEFRQQNADYIGESFACIAAADEHSAIIHYSPTFKSNTTIRNILLLDTGGQYFYGTTDVTRTVWVGNEEPPKDLKAFYTAVLRGHIAIARARFPEGTCLAQLEPLGRQFLWQKFLDYPHSTSHGIGYVSCVHESLGLLGNARDSRKIPLEAGMIVSNEPGCYLEGHFGVRLENMLLVKEAKEENDRKNKYKEGRYLEFETISKVPFDLRLIEEGSLTMEELEWIKEYG